MLIASDWRFWVALVAVVITIAGYVPYSRDIFRGTTTPHLFTWLIWTLTQGTAAAALLHGGGKFGSLSLITGTILVFAICVLSFKYGTKNITRSDTAALIAALIAIVIWWQLEAPIISVFMVTAIDLLGYIPTLRKSFAEPHSETISFWIMMTIAALLTLISNAEYNLLTLAYVSMLVVANLLVVFVCVLRRRVVRRIPLSEKVIPDFSGI